MAKQKPIFKILSYGIHSQWDRQSKDLPKIIKFTTQVPARLDIEFGYCLNIKHARGLKLEFTIDHPPFIDLKTGKTAPPFKGELFVRSNDWDFFLGDTLWSPIEDKVGKWRLITKLDGKIIVDKKFTVLADEGQFDNWDI